MIEVPGSEPTRRETAGDAAGGAADELDAALAAQAAMYTGPISLPLIEGEAAFRPDPARMTRDVPPPPDMPREPTLPPAPVLATPVPEYVAPDSVAAESPVLSTARPPDEEDVTRAIEEAASTSTLDAILMLETELRRREEMQEPSPAVSDADPSARRDAWLAAPPPSYSPPALVEPPPLGSVDDVDRAVELPPIPSAAGYPGDVTAHDLSHAPPPSAPAAMNVPPPAEIGVDTDVDADAIDEIDRVPSASSTVSGPEASSPVSEAEVAEIGTPEAVRMTDPSPLRVERSAAEPTPVERRAGHAARLFWLWFAANSSIVLVAVGATLFSYGMSLRQVLVAIVAGVGLSALPLGLGSLAGKWSGQPTMVVSRASFGLVGNALPAVLAVLGRVTWGGVLLWLLAATTAAMFPGAGQESMTAYAALAGGVVLAGLVAVFGYGLLHRVQRVLGILSVLLVGATIVLTAEHIDIEAALHTDDGPWLLAAGGAVMVFSVVGLAWAQSSSDLARYQNPEGSGAASMLWGSFGVIVPTLAILSWGALLAASDPETAAGLATAPLATLVSLVPEAFAIPVFCAAAFGLVAAAIVTIYSGGLAVVAVGIRMSRSAATSLAAALVAAVAVVLLLLDGDMREVVSEVITTLAVPVAAWTGIFASEMMIRLRRFHSTSLLNPGGVYPRVRWVNLVGLIAISAVGFGLTSSRMDGLDWQGFVFDALGVAAGGSLATSDIGVLVALLLGLLLPLVAGVPAIRRQERGRDEVDAATAELGSS